MFFCNDQNRKFKKIVKKHYDSFFKNLGYRIINKGEYGTYIWSKIPSFIAYTNNQLVVVFALDDIEEFLTIIIYKYNNSNNFKTFSNIDDLFKGIGSNDKLVLFKKYGMEQTLLNNFRFISNKLKELEQ